MFVITNFKIIVGKGKAPYKLIWLNDADQEIRRTHHKRLDLAHARAALWNHNFPVVLREEFIAQQKLATLRVVEPTEDEIAYARKLKKEGWE